LWPPSLFLAASSSHREDTRAYQECQLPVFLCTWAGWRMQQMVEGCRVMP
jgi:hypothetical protein